MKPFKHENEMNLSEVRQAIAWAEVNMDSLKPQYRGELEARLVALKERQRRLEWTERHIVRKEVK